jgi:DNA polymerase alpha subunit A
VPLTKQLSVVSGSLWSKTMQGARAQRIEMLLLHEFHDRKFILPDKLTARDKAAQVAAQANKSAKGKGAKGQKAGKTGAAEAGAADDGEEVSCWPLQLCSTK